MQPFWSPDGLWVGFAQGQSLMRAAVAGGQIEKICGMPTDMSAAGGGAWLQLHCNRPKLVRGVQKSATMKTPASQIGPHAIQREIGRSLFSLH